MFDQFNKLPLEIQLEIMYLLPKKDLVNIGKVIQENFIRK